MSSPKSIISWFPPLYENPSGVTSPEASPKVSFTNIAASEAKVPPE